MGARARARMKMKMKMVTSSDFLFLHASLAHQPRPGVPTFPDKLFRMKRRAKLSKLFIAYCQKKALDVRLMRFMFDGQFLRWGEYTRHVIHSFF